MPALVISAIICTYNPRPDLLHRVLDALRRQTLSRDAFEILIIDNNSDSPLRGQDWDPDGTLSVQLVREPRQGKVFAYHRASIAARAPLLCMLDDDNALDCRQPVSGRIVGEIRVDFRRRVAVCSADHSHLGM